jgi:hypothetical protein
VNRWQGWARQLRGRHGRRDALHARGAMVPMVLLQQQRGGMGSQLLVTSWRPIVQVHARFGVLRPVVMPALPVMRERAVASALAPDMLSHRRSDDAVSRSMPVAENVRQLAYPMPRFATPTYAQGPRRIAPAQFPERGIARFHGPARQSPVASTIAAQAVELATRLHRRATREELMLSPKPAVLAAAHRAPAPAGAVPSNEWTSAQPSPMQQIDSRALPQASAVDVESLTGLVIQQIDRRLIAYRERMGRV